MAFNLCIEDNIQGADDSSQTQHSDFSLNGFEPARLKRPILSESPLIKKGGADTGWDSVGSESPAAGGMGDAGRTYINSVGFAPDQNLSGVLLQAHPLLRVLL